MIRIVRTPLLPATPPTGDLVSEKGKPPALVQYHPGYGLGPRGVVSAYRQAEFGYPQWQCDMFDDVVESDGHLRSQLLSRKRSVAGKPWILQAGGDSAEDIDAAKRLEEALRNAKTFGPAISHQLTAPGIGWAASEIGWGYRDGLWVPEKFVNVPHRRFVFDDVGHMNLAIEGEPDGVPLAAGSWWISQADGHDQAVRAGLLRTATWWSVFKRTATRDWVVFCERFGIPYVTGEYEQSASDDTKRVLAIAIQRLGTEGGAMYEKGTTLTIHSVTDGGKSSDVHGSIVALANAEISKLVSGATLTSETGGPGSFALGKVHAGEAYSLRASDAEDLAQRFEYDVGAAFIAYNQLNARPPRLKINVVPDLDPLTQAQIMSIFANELGGKLDEDQVRQTFNLKAPASDAKALTGAKMGGVDTGAPSDLPAKPKSPNPAG